MTGLARDDHGMENGPQAERLYKALSHFLAIGLVVGPILVGVWFASRAIEDVKPLEPLPPPKIAPLPKLPNESEILPSPGATHAALNLAAGSSAESRLP